MTDNINDIFNLNIDEDLEALRKENTLSLKPSKPQLLSEDQEKALESMNEWVYRVYNNRDDQCFYRLTGSAGTGKTTLLNTFLKGIKAPYRTSQIVICAPTHKAKKVVREKTGWKNAETLQALVGIKADVNIEDFDPNNPAFSQIGERKMKDFKLMVLDEGSMVNDELTVVIMDTAKSCGCKVLFVGDIKQLNPVKQTTISACLTSPVNGYNLTQIVRQGKDNPLILLLDALRHDIENNTSTYMDILRPQPEQINSLGEGYMICKPEIFARYIEDEYNSEKFREDKNHCRYISWTNQSITDTNTWIRKKAIKVENLSANLDEVLLSYRTIMDGEDVILTNSDDYTIEKVMEQSVGEFGIRIRTMFVDLRGIDTGSVSKVHLLIKDEDNYKNYVALYCQQVDKAINTGGKRAWAKFYEFKNEILVLDNISTGRTDRWGRPEFIKKDIDYGYGITIHKSQGSTYNTVFVNGKDINKNPNDIERKRLWYVALSRASKIVYINL